MKWLPEPKVPRWVELLLRHGLMTLGRFQEAAARARAVLQTETADTNAHPWALLHLSAIAVFDGRPKEGQALIRQLNSLTSEWSVTGVRRRMGRQRDVAFVERYLSALSEAGLRAE